MTQKRHICPSPADLAELRSLRGVAQVTPIRLPALVRIPIAIALWFVAGCFGIVAFQGKLNAAGVEIVGFTLLVAFYVTIGWRFDLAFRRWRAARAAAKPPMDSIPAFTPGLN